MRKTDRRFVLAALAVLVMTLFAAPSLAQDAGAKAFLQGVYATYQTSDKAVGISSEKQAGRYFVPSLARLIGQDVAQSKKRNEVGKLDFDLVRTTAGWRIADIHWSGQPDSFVAIMTKKD